MVLDLQKKKKNYFHNPNPSSFCFLPMRCDAVLGRYFLFYGFGRWSGGYSLLPQPPPNSTNHDDLFSTAGDGGMTLSSECVLPQSFRVR